MMQFQKRSEGEIHMRKISLFDVCLFIIAAFIIAGTATWALAAEQEKKEEPKLSVKLNGRIFGDWFWGSASDELATISGDFVSGNEWRAAWIELNGDYGDNIEFKAWYDVAGGTTTAKDVWIGLKNLPFGSLRVGHMKEPFSLEQLIANKNNTFMERALPDIFTPSRNTGIGIFGNTMEGRVYYGFGVFTDANEQGTAATHDDTYNFTARITGLAWEGSKSELMHLGGGVHYRGGKEGGSFRFNARPESHLAYRMADTGSFKADSALMYNAEAAMVMGRLSVQSEYIGVTMDAPLAGDPSFNGFYVFASYFLTDDYRPYTKSAGAFGAVKPSAPYTPNGDGMGAWELAVRYSRLDLEDGLVLGGVLTDVTVGVNWYVTGYVRIMANYIHADSEDRGTADIVQMRYQFTF